MPLTGKVLMDGEYDDSGAFYSGFVDLSDPANVYAFRPGNGKFPFMLKFLVQALEEVFGAPPYTKDQIWDKRVYNYNEGRTTELYNEAVGGNHKYMDYFTLFLKYDEKAIIDNAIADGLEEFVYPRLSDDGKSKLMRIMGGKYNSYNTEKKARILDILDMDEKTFDSYILMINMGLA